MQLPPLWQVLAMELKVWPWPTHEKPQQSLVFFVGQAKWMRMAFLLLSPASILSETNSNL
jgi:hypothetical protein